MSATPDRPALLRQFRAPSGKIERSSGTLKRDYGLRFRYVTPLTAAEKDAICALLCDGLYQRPPTP